MNDDEGGIRRYYFELISRDIGLSLILILLKNTQIFGAHLFFFQNFFFLKISKVRAKKQENLGSWGDQFVIS